MFILMMVLSRYLFICKVDYILPKTCHCFTYNVPNRDKPSNHMNVTITMTNPYSFNSYK